MNDTKQKYVRLSKYDEIIIFPLVIEHSTFSHLKPISSGFCYINKNNVSCFGKSISLKLESNAKDSLIATRQLFGY